MVRSTNRFRHSNPLAGWVTQRFQHMRDSGNLLTNTTNLFDCRWLLFLLTL